MPLDQTAVSRVLGRIYFVAVIPFFGAVVGPWLLGSLNLQEVPVFLLWSFTVLVFTSAALFGALALSPTQFVLPHLMVALIFAAVGLLALVFADGASGLFAGVTVLLVLHWLNLMWTQRTALWQKLPGDWRKQHGRFVWIALACHMLVLLNLIRAIRIE